MTTAKVACWPWIRALLYGAFCQDCIEGGWTKPGLPSAPGTPQVAVDKMMDDVEEVIRTPIEKMLNK